jgi:hypothetical protein
MLGDRIARIIARVALNSVALVAVLGVVVVALRAHEPVSVVVTVLAVMVPVFCTIEVAAALAKVEPTNRRGSASLSIVALAAVPLVIAASVAQRRDRQSGAVTVAAVELPTPNADAAIARLSARYNGAGS